MEKSAVSKGSAGFTQSRIGRRPYRADTLLNKQQSKGDSSPTTPESPKLTDTSDSDMNQIDQGLAADAGDEFVAKEASVPEFTPRSVHQDRLDLLLEHLSKIAKIAKKEFAPGIPLSRRVESIEKVPERGANKEWDLAMQLHPAAKRGKHIDLRLVDSKGRAHSWALPRELPAPGKNVYAIQQPTHTKEYSLQEKPFEIKKGYGRTKPGAQVEPMHVGKTEVVEANDDKVRFLQHGRRTKEFVLRKVKGDKTWVLHNATKNVNTIEGKKLPQSKPKYKSIDPDQINVDDDSKALTAKIDGAHTLVALHGKERHARVYSYRPTASETGLIEHTHKLPNFNDIRGSEATKGALVRAEMWFSDKNGKAIPVQQISGLLNSGTLKSRDKQKELGVRPRLTIIDVIRRKGKNVENAPYAEKREIMQQITKDVSQLELPPTALTAEDKKRLISKIRDRTLPQTKEGLVEHDLHKPGVFTKAVIRPNHDVYVRGVFTKERGKARGHAGGFEYSWTPDDPVAGRVGTGFNHAMKKDMLKNPDKFVGRVAVVSSADKYENKKDPSQIGSLRAPSFQHWHVDKNDPEQMMDKEGGFDPEEYIPESVKTVRRAAEDISQSAKTLDPEKMTSATKRSAGSIFKTTRGAKQLRIADEVSGGRLRKWIAKVRGKSDGKVG